MVGNLYDEVAEPGMQVDVVDPTVVMTTTLASVLSLKCPLGWMIRLRYIANYSATGSLSSIFWLP